MYKKENEQKEMVNEKDNGENWVFFNSTWKQES